MCCSEIVILRKTAAHNVSRVGIILANSPRRKLTARRPALLARPPLARGRALAGGGIVIRQ
jgi:hypothetical protein